MEISYYLRQLHPAKTIDPSLTRFGWIGLPIYLDDVQLPSPCSYTHLPRLSSTSMKLPQCCDLEFKFEELKTIGSEVFDTHRFLQSWTFFGSCLQLGILSMLLEIYLIYNMIKYLSFDLCLHGCCILQRKYIGINIVTLKLQTTFNIIYLIDKIYKLAT